MKSAVLAATVYLKMCFPPGGGPGKTDKLTLITINPTFTIRKNSSKESTFFFSRLVIPFRSELWITVCDDLKCNIHAGIFPMGTAHKGLYCAQIWVTGREGTRPLSKSQKPSGHHNDRVYSSSTRLCIELFNSQILCLVLLTQCPCAVQKSGSSRCLLSAGSLEVL